MSNTRAARGGEVATTGNGTDNPPQDFFSQTVTQAIDAICAGNEKRSREIKTKISAEAFTARCTSLGVVLTNKTDVLPYLQSNWGVLLLTDSEFNFVTAALLKAIPKLKKQHGSELTFERLGDPRNIAKRIEEIEREATLEPQLTSTLNELRVRGIHAQAWLAIVAYGLYQGGEAIDRTGALPIDEILSRVSSHVEHYDRNRAALVSAIQSLVDNAVVTKVSGSPDTFFMDLQSTGRAEHIQRFVSFVDQNIEWLMKHFFRKPIVSGMIPHEKSIHRSVPHVPRPARQSKYQAMPLDELFLAFIESTHDDETKAREMSDALLERTSNSLEDLRAMLEIFSKSNLYQARFAFELVVSSVGACLSQTNGESQKISEHMIEEVLEYFRRETDDEIRGEAEEFLREQVGQFDHLSIAVLELSQRNEAAASFIKSITRNRILLEKIVLNDVGSN